MKPVEIFLYIAAFNFSSASLDLILHMLTLDESSKGSAGRFYFFADGQLRPI